MSLATIFAIAVALAMDAFAVALTTGLRLPAAGIVPTLRLAGAFGLFQFLMPILGWLLGIGAQHYIAAYDHWLAFGLLLFVGGKMLHEAWENRGKHDDDCRYSDPTSGRTLLMLSLATSLDAMAVGLSMALLNVDVWGPAVIIGLVCFAVTAVGMGLGRFICTMPWLASLGNIGNKATTLGGLVLIAIGLGILREHGVFSP